MVGRAGAPRAEGRPYALKRGPLPLRSRNFRPLYPVRVGRLEISFQRLLDLGDLLDLDLALFHELLRLGGERLGEIGLGNCGLTVSHEQVVPSLDMLESAGLIHEQRQAIGGQSDRPGQQLLLCPRRRQRSRLAAGRPVAMDRGRQRSRRRQPCSAWRQMRQSPTARRQSSCHRPGDVLRPDIAPPRTYRVRWQMNARLTPGTLPRRPPRVAPRERERKVQVAALSRPETGTPQGRRTIAAARPCGREYSARCPKFGALPGTHCTLLHQAAATPFGVARCRRRGDRKQLGEWYPSHNRDRGTPATPASRRRAP
jgi:hypothetical protein